MPWLQVTTARLTQQDILEIASQCALQSLLELRLKRFEDGVSLVGVPSDRQDRILSFILASATLHRLVVRRSVMLDDRIRACNILLHCEEEMASAVATLLTSYYYWFGMLEVDEAICLAETALSATVSKVSPLNGFSGRDLVLDIVARSNGFSLRTSKRAKGFRHRGMELRRKSCSSRW